MLFKKKSKTLATENQTITPSPKETAQKPAPKTASTTEVLFDEQKALSRWGVYDSVAQIGVGSLVVATGVNGMVNGGLLGTGGQFVPMAILLPVGSFSIVTGQDFAYRGVNKLCQQLEDWNKKMDTKENTKEEPKIDTKEEPKVDTKENPTVDTKEEPTVDTKEDPKVNTKEEPNVDAVDTNDKSKEESKEEIKDSCTHHETAKNEVVRNFSTENKAPQPKQEKAIDLKLAV